MKQIDITNIPKEKFVFCQRDDNLGDKKLATKSVSYFRDVWRRFCKNKSSVVAAGIIAFLVLFSILTPLFANNSYNTNLNDNHYLYYSKLPPRSKLFGWLGVNGNKKVTCNAAQYLAYKALGEETGLNPIVKEYRSDYVDESGDLTTTYYDLLLDSYYKMDMLSLTLTTAQYRDIQSWQNENGKQIIFPAVDKAQMPDTSATNDANIWYLCTRGNHTPILNASGEFQEAYLKAKPITDPSKRAPDTYGGEYTSLRMESDPAYGAEDPNTVDGRYLYAQLGGTLEFVKDELGNDVLDSQGKKIISKDNRTFTVRVSRYNYFIYRYGFEPSFGFGTDAGGQDILTRLATGARFSIVFAIVISAINLFIGAVYGAVEGYYGGTIDLVMERISDILVDVPFIVVTTLFQLHFKDKVGVVGALLFAFVLTGWIGMASRVRMQFYRFKNQEYILAARTLGAKDGRLMFKHIFPNAMGTIITGSILSIPGVIFSESSLTYLGIVNLESGNSSFLGMKNLTSVGTMLAKGKDYLQAEPHIILFPALFISLLMVSFNLFGNGLRDAFNPSLRGMED